MTDYRVDFAALDWQSPMEGVRHKVATDRGRTLRLVEYSRAMPAHWCEKGHIGCIIDGIIEIEFDDGVRKFRAGDGVSIPDGAAHRHRARTVTDTVTAIFIEDA